MVMAPLICHLTTQCVHRGTNQHRTSNCPPESAQFPVFDTAYWNDWSSMHQSGIHRTSSLWSYITDCSSTLQIQLLSAVSLQPLFHWVDYRLTTHSDSLYLYLLSASAFNKMSLNSVAFKKKLFCRYSVIYILHTSWRIESELRVIIIN